jgi:hypothetical protein
VTPISPNLDGSKLKLMKNVGSKTTWQQRRIGASVQEGQV